MFIEPPKHIIVPIDGSETSSYAASYAAMLQKQFNSRVTLVFVFGFVSSEDITHSASMKLALEEEKQESVQILEKEKNTAFSPDAMVSTVVLEGSVTDNLISFIEESDGDLVVMGSQGLGSPFKRLFVGSVAKQVITHVEKPVLVVRAPQKEG